MKYSDRFPEPEGDVPPNPPDQPVCPARTGSKSEDDAAIVAFEAAKKNWRKLATARNDFTFARRKYAVAVAVDKIIEQEKIRTPSEVIAMVIGMSWLEGTLCPQKAEDVFTALFGGL